MKRGVIRRKAIEPKSSADGEPDSRDVGVQSVDRALSIIETLAEDDEGYRLSDLAIRTGLSTSTVHRLLATLENRRYAVGDEEACMGLRCIAAVVYNDCAEPLAAISVSGMTSRLTDDRLPILGQTVREVAAELTMALGGVMPEAKSA